MEAFMEAGDGEQNCHLSELMLWSVLEVYDECARRLGRHDRVSGYPTQEYKERCMKRLDELFWAQDHPKYTAGEVVGAEDQYKLDVQAASWQIGNHPYFRGELDLMRANKLVLNARELEMKGWSIQQTVRQMCRVIWEVREHKISAGAAKVRLAKLERELEILKLRLVNGGHYCTNCVKLIQDCRCAPIHPSEFEAEGG